MHRSNGQPYTDDWDEKDAPSTPLSPLPNPFDEYEPFLGHRTDESSDEVENASRRNESRTKRWPFFALLISLTILVVASTPATRITALRKAAGFRQNSLQPNTTRPFSNIRVGKRRISGLFKGCNSSELLDSLSRAKLRQDGKSRLPGKSSPKKTQLDLREFKFSFDLPDCPAPHIFTPEEACDLLSAFGGVFFRGDSIARFFSSSLFFLISDSLDIVTSHHQECAGESYYLNGKKCRIISALDSQKYPEKSVCDVNPFLRFEQAYKFRTNQRRSQSSARAQKTGSVHRHKYKAGELPLEGVVAGNLTAFRESLPEERQALSPVVIFQHGIHYQFRSEDTIDFHIKPFLQAFSSTVPRPISLWSSYSPPGPLKPKEHIKDQGPDVISNYNSKIRDFLKIASPEPLNEGGMKQLEWFEATNGAFSYDGTHHSYQVNMEKGQFLLNLLDALYGEIVEQGGLVE
ncbi:hypothetical protein T439DRAFT_379262 [Meredithblackwellia eburnea MCA 4105]